MILEIITPEREVFKGEVISVKFPGTNGGFEILKDHAPIISTLTKGEIKIRTKGEDSHNFNINGGVIEMQSNKIIVLAD